MSIWIPWVATFLVSAVLFLIGLALQHTEKKRRLRRRVSELLNIRTESSAFDALHPYAESPKTAQSAKSSSAFPFDQMGTYGGQEQKSGKGALN